MRTAREGGPYECLRIISTHIQINIHALCAIVHRAHKKGRGKAPGLYKAYKIEKSRFEGLDFFIG